MSASDNMKNLILVLVASVIMPQLSFARDHEPNFWKNLEAKKAPVIKVEEKKQTVCSDKPCCEKKENCCG